MTPLDYRQLFTDFKGTESDLIPILQKTQDRLGYISLEATKEISRFLKLSENQIFGVASFYSQFRFTPPGKNSIKICMGTACHVKGGQILCETVERNLGISPGQTTADQKFDFHRVACLGCCALAPVVQINDDIYSQINVTKLQEILKKYE
ncbi:MAG: NADH-quinone oxidoreductase subunit NuoE [bacterium]|nr:NADH-quinone oxidoreductase subunit NuoE [bacterium]